MDTELFDGKGLRDARRAKWALEAMKIILNNRLRQAGVAYEEYIAKEAYAMADAMLAQEDQ